MGCDAPPSRVRRGGGRGRRVDCQPMQTHNVVLLIVLLGVGLAAIAGLVLVAIVGGFLWFGYNVTHDPTLEEFAKVQPGMTYEQVVKTMGRAFRDQQQLPDGTLACRWSHTEDTQYVWVFFRDGVVVRKSTPGDDPLSHGAFPATAPAVPATRPG